MGSNIEELRNSVRRWKSLIGKDMSASIYFGLARGTLMFATLPSKEMKIAKLVLVEQTGRDEAGNETGKEHIYNVALTEDAGNLFGSVVAELNEICLKVSKTNDELQKAILPNGTYCWNDDSLKWVPWQESELEKYCL